MILSFRVSQHKPAVVSKHLPPIADMTANVISLIYMQENISCRLPCDAGQFQPCWENFFQHLGGTLSKCKRTGSVKEEEKKNKKKDIQSHFKTYVFSKTETMGTLKKNW